MRRNRWGWGYEERAVALEVAIFNILLAVCMVSRLTTDQQDAHKEDMLAFLASDYIGPWAEWCVRIVGGLLLLSAVNTVITDMISVQYLLSDTSMPRLLESISRSDLRETTFLHRAASGSRGL